MNLEPVIHKIYVLKDPRDGSIRYVGFTTYALSKRLNGHLKERRANSRKFYWFRSLKDLGLRPTIELLEEVCAATWAEKERKWIKHYKDIGCDLTNLTDGGEGNPGYKMSQEQRASVSRVHKGKILPEHVKEATRVFNRKRWETYRASGQTMSPEARAAISERNTGRKHSPEARAKMSEAGKGKPKSPEHRAKLAEHCRHLEEAHKLKRAQQHANT